MNGTRNADGSMPSFGQNIQLLNLRQEHLKRALERIQKDGHSWIQLLPWSKSWKLLEVLSFVEQVTGVMKTSHMDGRCICRD